MYIHIYIYIYAHIHLLIYMDVYVYVCIHAACIDTYVHPFIHTHMHMRKRGSSDESLQQGGFWGRRGSGDLCAETCWKRPRERAAVDLG